MQACAPCGLCRNMLTICFWFVTTANTTVLVSNQEYMTLEQLHDVPHAVANSLQEWDAMQHIRTDVKTWSWFLVCGSPIHHNWRGHRQLISFTPHVFCMSQVVSAVFAHNAACKYGCVDEGLHGVLSMW